MKKIYHALCKAEVTICAVAFVALVAFVFLSAVLRFFRFSMSWNIDIALFLLAWTAFLGADIAWRNNQLVGMDLLVRNLPKMVAKFVLLAVYLIVFAGLTIIVVYGLRLSWVDRLRTYQSIPIPFSLVTLSLVTAALSMLVSTIIKIKRWILDFNK